MPFVAGALLSHSPLLVPNIGKANRQLFSATLEAAQKVSAAFSQAQVDTIIVITNHGQTVGQHPVLTFGPRFVSDFSTFGDLVTEWPYTSALMLAARVREQLENSIPFRLYGTEKLDYASSIALNLAGISEKTPVLPITMSTFDLKEHAHYGKKLQEFLLTEDRRFGILGCLDLSHRLTAQSPAGFSPKAKKLDQKIISALVNKKTREILSLSPALLEETAVEDASSLAFFLGLLDNFNYEVNLLSYESPFGVGHPVVLYTF